MQKPCAVEIVGKQPTESFQTGAHLQSKPLAQSVRPISNEDYFIDWEVKYDTGNTYSQADINLTPEIVSQLGLMKGGALKPFSTLPSETVFQYGSVNVRSPVDHDTSVPLITGVICNADGTVLERDIAIISLWGMAKLNCKVHPEGAAASSGVRLVKACEFNMCNIP